tara:strand:- start:480 stop:884 length:405 start_codon:yes stop_codon:yes gene_type:complete
MITLTLNISNLNNSLQVGDLIYAVDTVTQVGSNDAEAVSANTGNPNIVGILRRITAGTVLGQIQNAFIQVILDVDESLFFNTYVPNVNDFIMFSKYEQTDGDVIGYYAQAKFINNSKEKAEIYSVGSEVIINSK